MKTTPDNRSTRLELPTGSCEPEEPTPATGERQHGSHEKSQYPIELPDRYEMVGELGRGGMGVVYAVQDRHLHRELALKVLSPYNDSDSLYARFIEEAQISAQLQHPGIVPIYDVGRLPNDQTYFTMKRVEGHTLAAALRSRDVQDADLQWLDVFEQICQAVGYAHARGVIHRDLKPSNVMLGNHGEVQVMDWGVAKLFPVEHSSADSVGRIRTIRDDEFDNEQLNQNEPTLTQRGSALGTAAYLSPEQALGNTSQLRPHSDVFLLGGILAEIITGSPTYAAMTKQECHLMAVRGDLEPCYQRIEQSTYPESLKKLARRCLQRNPCDRPANATAISQAIAEDRRQREDRLRSAEIHAAASQARFEEARQTVLAEQRRRRIAVVAVVLATGLVLAIVAGYFSITAFQNESELARRDAQLTELRAQRTHQAQQVSNQKRFETIHSLVQSTVEQVSLAASPPSRREQSRLSEVADRLRADPLVRERLSSESSRAEELLVTADHLIRLSQFVEAVDRIDASVDPFGLPNETVDWASSRERRQRSAADAYRRLFESTFACRWEPHFHFEFDSDQVPNWAMEEVIASLQKWRTLRSWVGVQSNAGGQRNAGLRSNAGLRTNTDKPIRLGPIIQQLESNTHASRIWGALARRQIDELATTLQACQPSDLPDAVAMAACEYLIQEGSRHRTRRLNETMLWEVLRPITIEAFDGETPEVDAEGWIRHSKATPLHGRRYLFSAIVPNQNLTAIRIETRVTRDTETATDQSNAVAMGPGLLRNGPDGCLISHFEIKRTIPELRSKKNEIAKRGIDTSVLVADMDSTHPAVRGRELFHLVDGDHSTFWSVVHEHGVEIESAVLELRPQLAYHKHLVLEIISGDPHLRVNSQLGCYRIAYTTEPLEEWINYQDLAVSTLENIAARRPGERRIAMRLAHQHRHLMPPDVASSLTFASAAITADPQDADAVGLLAQIVLDQKPGIDSVWYRRLLRHVERLDDPTEQDRLRREIASYQIERGDAAFDQQPEMALEAYGEAIGLSPSSFDRYTELGWKLHQSRQFQSAEQAFLVATESQSPKATVYRELGRFYDLRDKHGPALRAMEKANELFPNDPLVLPILARLRFQARRFEDGETILKQLADSEQLDDTTIGRCLMTMAARSETADEADRVSWWANWWLERLDRFTTSWSREQAETLMRVMLSLAKLDRTEVASDYFRPDHPKHVIVRESLFATFNEALMQRGFDTDPLIETPTLVQKIIETMHTANPHDRPIAMRCQLLRMILDDSSKTAVDLDPSKDRSGLGALISLLQQTPRDQWPDLSPTVLGQHIQVEQSSDDRNLMEWLWWEYRMTGQTSKPWSGWTINP